MAEQSLLRVKKCVTSYSYSQNNDAYLGKRRNQNAQQRRRPQEQIDSYHMLVLYIHTTHMYCYVELLIS